LAAWVGAWPAQLPHETWPGSPTPTLPEAQLEHDVAPEADANLPPEQSTQDE
jgi:hypothetical protein